MEAAAGAGDKAKAEIVACECVTIAELKDHLDWELIGEAAKKLSGAGAKALRGASPPEERKHVKSAIGAARAEAARSKMR